jgi:hypothetical protein
MATIAKIQSAPVIMKTYLDFCSIVSSLSFSMRTLYHKSRLTLLSHKPAQNRLSKGIFNRFDNYLVWFYSMP